MRVLVIPGIPRLGRFRCPRAVIPLLPTAIPRWRVVVVSVADPSCYAIREIDGEQRLMASCGCLLIDATQSHVTVVFNNDYVLTF